MRKTIIVLAIFLFILCLAGLPQISKFFTLNESFPSQEDAYNMQLDRDKIYTLLMDDVMSDKYTSLDTSSITSVSYTGIADIPWALFYESTMDQSYNKILDNYNGSGSYHMLWMHAPRCRLTFQCSSEGDNYNFEILSEDNNVLIKPQAGEDFEELFSKLGLKPLLNYENLLYIFQYFYEYRDQLTVGENEDNYYFKGRLKIPLLKMVGAEALYGLTYYYGDLTPLEYCECDIVIDIIKDKPNNGKIVFDFGNALLEAYPDVCEYPLYTSYYEILYEYK